MKNDCVREGDIERDLTLFFVRRFLVLSILFLFFHSSSRDYLLDIFLEFSEKQKK